MKYKSAAALEMAVKSAAAASPIDTGRTVTAFYFHRLLCRVFADGNDSFVLKGGRAMLARTADARATRDIDLRIQDREMGRSLTSSALLSVPCIESHLQASHSCAMSTENETQNGPGCPDAGTRIALQASGHPASHGTSHEQG